MNLQQRQKTETRTTVKRITALIVAAAALLASVGGAVVYAQGGGKDNDKYSLKSPGGIAFSDFRGYEVGRWCRPPAPKKCLRSSSPIRQ